MNELWSHKVMACKWLTGS